MQQRSYIGFVLAPTLKRAAEQGFADLDSTGGFDRSAGSIEADAAIIPRQAAIIDQPPGLAFKIIEHLLVRDIEYGAWRKHGSPVSHQFAVTAVKAAQVRQIVAKIQTGYEQLRLTRHAGIHRIAHGMD